MFDLILALFLISPLESHSVRTLNVIMATSGVGLAWLLPTLPPFNAQLQLNPPPRENKYSIAARVQALTLLYCTVGPASKQKYDWIYLMTGVKPRTQQDIARKAKERGYDPQKDLRIKDEYVAESKRSGRLVTAVTEENIDKIISLVRKDRNGREKSSEMLAFETGISPRSALRCLKKGKMRKVKPYYKPALAQICKEKRLKWCLEHRDWHKIGPFPGLWRYVIWTDETSVRLGHRRGGTRIWRRAHEESDLTCVRRRWSGYMDFMFWGAFTYDYKCEPHIWEKETAAEKKAAKDELKAWNDANEERLKTEWEIENGVRRLNMNRNLGGPKPQWHFDTSTGKKVRRKGKGGIDWFRYGRVILEGKLLPFAKECQRRWGREAENCIVVEDNAPAHAHHAQGEIYNLWNVQRMLWPPNSPDLNMIEPAWPHLKRTTTVRGAPRVRSKMKESWNKAWWKMPQKKIQQWIERIPRHIEKVIALEGGNEYKEGRLERDSRVWKGQRIKGKLSRRVDNSQAT